MGNEAAKTAIPTGAAEPGVTASVSLIVAGRPAGDAAYRQVWSADRARLRTMAGTRPETDGGRMIRQPPEDSERAEPGSPRTGPHLEPGEPAPHDRVAPAGYSGPEPTQRLPGAEPASGGAGEVPTRRLPAVPERFTPGRARATPVPEPVSAAPVTAAYPPPYRDPYPEPEYAFPVAASTNSVAMWALVCSIVGLFTCFLLSPIGALLGHIARRRIRRTGEAGDGLAVAGIVIGWLGVALFAVCCGGILIIANSIGLGDFWGSL
jgi:hypothetical protein